LKSPRELLRRRRYRTPVFLRLYLDHVEEVRFRDPRAGLKLARFAPQLALLVPEAGGPEGRREHRENLVRARAALGAAFRTAGDVVVAESEYMQAKKIADSEAISPIVRGDLSRGLATLRACQKRFDEALALIESAEAAFRAVGDQRRQAEAQAVRGYVLNEAGRFFAAIPCHGEALALALELERAKPADPAEVAALARVVEASRANLAYAVSQDPRDRVAGRVLRQIAAAKRAIRGRRDCLIRHLLEWTEGKVYQRLNRLDRAETRYKRARRGFVRLELPWETALVSLDHGSLLRAGERWEELEALAADTFGRFRELCADFEAIAALSLWVDAVKARRGAAAAITAAREVLEARKARA